MKGKETKTVNVSVFWRWEDNRQIEVPADMELSEVRDKIDWNSDFDASNSDLVEFDVYLVEDDEGNEWGVS